jgi:hypothetical protein
MNLVLDLFCYFGGLLFVVLSLSLFDIQCSNAIKIMSVFISLIPLFGCALFFFTFIVFLFTYQRDCFYNKCNVVRPKSTKFHRFLFNDVDWECYDEEIKENKE